jgi:hypothetical protein
MKPDCISELPVIELCNSEAESEFSIPLAATAHTAARGITQQKQVPPDSCVASGTFSRKMSKPRGTLKQGFETSHDHAWFRCVRCGRSWA